MAGTIEDMLRDIDAQEQALRQSAEALPAAHRDVQVAIATAAFEEIVATSPVRTGAYRAEHVGEIGNGESVSQVVYESPSRPGPDATVSLDAGTTLEAPSGGDFKNAAEDIPPFQSFQIANRRFYAPLLEFGTATMEPRAVYARAAASAEAVAERTDIPLARLGIVER